jgi:hypothetical protein
MTVRRNISWMRIRLAALLLVAGCGHSAVVPAAMPVMVLPGIVSTAEPEFAFTMTAKGDEVWFDRASADRRTLTIMTSRLEGGRWSEPAATPFTGSWRDVDPWITPDGSMLFFSSNRPVPGGAGTGFHAWYARRGDGGSWSEPAEAGRPMNSDSSDTFVSASRDSTFVFASNRDGHQRLYRVMLSSGRSYRPIWVGLRALFDDSIVDAGNPAIAPSGRFIVFARAPRGERAQLYFSCHSAGAPTIRDRPGYQPAAERWSVPRPLSDAVNSAFAEFAPFIDAREQNLYFTSERPGLVGAQPDSVRPPGDIYRIPLRQAGIACGR